MKEGNFMAEKVYEKPVWSYADSMARLSTTGIARSSTGFSLRTGDVGRVVRAA
jgi:hypothetical protein